METTSIYAIPAIALRKQKKPSAIDRIVCRNFNITTDQLHIRTRRREVCNARQVCMWWLCKYETLKLWQIGELYGPADKAFDHATVLHAKKTVDNLIATDRNFRQLVLTIESEASNEILQHSPEWHTMQLVKRAKELLETAMHHAQRISDPGTMDQFTARLVNTLIELER